jgi:quercetin dioxygenase-like cupin family protein
MAEELVRKLEAEGYDKVFVYDAPPGDFDEEHTHDFDTKLVILDGEIQIKMDANKILSNFVYKKGREVTIPRHSPHETKAGPHGCRYIVAERYN